MLKEQGRSKVPFNSCTVKIFTMGSFCSKFHTFCKWMFMFVMYECLVTKVIDAQEYIGRYLCTSEIPREGYKKQTRDILLR